ncbi:TPA: hypothetical protein ACH3X1_012247 [Trebouxia sp. C0004]
MVTNHPEDWDMHLPAILMGYRGSIQASTRFSPFYLLHGYEMPLPVRSLDPIPPPADGKLGQTVQALLQAMEPIHAARIAAHSNISQAQERNKRSYARRTNHSAAPTAARKLTTEEKEASEAGPCADRHAVQPGDFVMLRQLGQQRLHHPGGAQEPRVTVAMDPSALLQQQGVTLDQLSDPSSVVAQAAQSPGYHC